MILEDVLFLKYGGGWESKCEAVTGMISERDSRSASSQIEREGLLSLKKG